MNKKLDNNISINLESITAKLTKLDQIPTSPYRQDSATLTSPMARAMLINYQNGNSAFTTTSMKQQPSLKE